MLPKDSHIDLFLGWKTSGNWTLPATYDSILNAKNSMCGDECNLYIERKENQIRILSLGGESCSICQASMGILFSNQTLWSKDFFLNQLEIRKNALEDETLSKRIPVDERRFWELILTYPNRHRCALLPWVALGKGF
ncbi:iron-sulfur cluster assembly scaffold protein [Leptospira ilyithenensis]|uniref:Iron-sulfur cluster assembly scaffold protein n=1 Tax=Leptospira ilyithenensis TaxID=2484901 RepID=A0A4R9LMN9_9LEPT|nr:iron-sulfur cluster assembly scaffold protein [Leptospira ilyithenensis]